MVVIVMILPGLIQGHHSTIHDDFLIEILRSVKRRSNYNYNFAILRIWDVHIGSQILISSIPADPGSRIPDPTKKEDGKDQIGRCLNFL